MPGEEDEEEVKKGSGSARQRPRRGWQPMLVVPTDHTVQDKGVMAPVVRISNRPQDNAYLRR